MEDRYHDERKQSTYIVCAGYRKKGTWYNAIHAKSGSTTIASASRNRCEKPDICLVLYHMYTEKVARTNTHLDTTYVLYM